VDNVATMPAERRLELFRETAARTSLSVDLVEKDFWGCWSLCRLFSRMADLPATLLFKGGTSLSKVFNAIERFSEDVDLSLNREDLGVAVFQSLLAGGPRHGQDVFRRNVHHVVA